MIRPLNIEIRVIFYIILFGIFFFITSDLVNYIINKNKKKRIRNVIIEIIYVFFQLYLTYEFCYRLDEGYIPIYFILFIFTGIILYYLFLKESTNKLFYNIDQFIHKSKKYYVPLFYSKTFINILKKIGVFLIVPFKKIILQIKAKKKILGNEETIDENELNNNNEVVT